MKQQVSKTSICGYPIVIDSSKIPIKDRPQWEVDNIAYYSSTPVGFRIEIDANKIPSVNLAQWLFDNQYYITYDDSYQYIECVHLITKAADVKIVEDSPELCRMSYDTLVTEIENATINFTTPSYQKYAWLTIASNKLTVTAVAQFGIQANCFSVPFFKSILHNNPTFNSNSVLVFKQPESIGNLDRKICISVEVASTIVKSYNFSQDPP